MKVKTIPESLQFYPPAVDGYFWAKLAALLPYLANPSELAKLYEENFEAYTELTAGYVKFIIETEKELDSKGLLEEIDYSPEST